VTHTTQTPRVFLDAAGHAPVHPQARAALLEAVEQGWADPRRLHAEGRRARMLLDGARESIAAQFGARPAELRFAGSHVTALHTAVRGVTRGRRRVGRDVVASAVERAALLDAARFATAQGDVPGAAALIPVDRTGRVAPDRFIARLREGGVALAALQHANGEVGSLQPIAEVHAAARESDVPLLVDAGSSVGHVPVPDAWDLLAADAGDWGAPVGLGLLAVRPRVRWAPDWPEDDDPWFPGGVSVPAALAAAVALDLARSDLAVEDAHRRALVARIRAEVPIRVPDVQIVGADDERLPHVVTFSCLYVDGEALVTELDRAGFAVASGSACTSSALEPSHVLAAMGVLTHGNVRITVPRGTDAAHVERFLDVLPTAVATVRSTLGAEGL
jgi:cysteine desulfurase